MKNHLPSATIFISGFFYLMLTTSVATGQINKSVLEDYLFQEYVDDTVRVMLSGLPSSDREIAAISSVISNTNYLGPKALEKNFKGRSGGHSVIHVATHAFINDHKPLLSKFIFSKDPSEEMTESDHDQIASDFFDDLMMDGDEIDMGDDDSATSLYTEVNNDLRYSIDRGYLDLDDGYLNTYEIFNADLSANLAVLSACNTGFGGMNRGEGVMSLARAFSYAGCPTMVISLWPASDRSTAIIMREFYLALGDGMEVDAALQHAKKRYIAQVHPDEAAPYYWAGFIAIGKMNTVDIRLKSEEKAQWAYYTLGSFFFIGIFGFSPAGRRIRQMTKSRSNKAAIRS